MKNVIIILVSEIIFFCIVKPFLHNLFGIIFALVGGLIIGFLLTYLFNTNDKFKTYLYFFTVDNSENQNRKNKVLLIRLSIIFIILDTLANIFTIKDIYENVYLIFGVITFGFCFISSFTLPIILKSTFNKTGFLIGAFLAGLYNLYDFLLKWFLLSSFIHGYDCGEWCGLENIIIGALNIIFIITGLIIFLFTKEQRAISNKV